MDGPWLSCISCWSSKVATLRASLSSSSVLCWSACLTGAKVVLSWTWDTSKEGETNTLSWPTS